MLKGKIKFFNKGKGFGFIVNDETGKDVFFHYTSVAKGHEITMKDEGKPVLFELVEGKKGPEANNVKLAA